MFKSACLNVKLRTVSWTQMRGELIIIIIIIIIIIMIMIRFVARTYPPCWVLKARIQKHRGKPLLFHDKCPGFFYVPYTTHGTYSFTSHPKDEAIMVKCLAQRHKRRDRPGRDSNPHSGNTRTWVKCTRPLGHNTPLFKIRRQWLICFGYIQNYEWVVTSSVLGSYKGWLLTFTTISCESSYFEWLSFLLTLEDNNEFNFKCLFTYSFNKNTDVLPKRKLLWAHQ